MLTTDAFCYIKYNKIERIVSIYKITGIEFIGAGIFFGFMNIWDLE